jgi:hypothetical protein
MLQVRRDAKEGDVAVPRSTSRTARRGDVVALTTMRSA